MLPKQTSLDSRKLMSTTKDIEVPVSHEPIGVMPVVLENNALAEFAI